MRKGPLPFTSRCPSCGALMDDATGIHVATAEVNESAVPEEGSVTICFYCGEGLVFAEGMHLRALTGEELLGLPPELPSELFAMFSRVRNEIARRKIAVIVGVMKGGTGR